MAIDSRDKRFSMIGLASSFRRLLANPTGTVTAAAKYMLEFLYSGIALAEPPQVSSHIFSFLAGSATSRTLKASNVNVYTLSASRSI